MLIARPITEAEMAVKVWGAALQGIDAVPIVVEVDLLRRLPSVVIVGLAAHAVREAAERVRSAIASTGTDFPRQRVVINLAPADVRKDGTAFDVPVACGILAAAGELPLERLQRTLLVGELSLSGELRAVRGALSFAMLARDQGLQIVLPMRSAAEASLVPGADVRGANTLAEVLAHLRGEVDLPAVASTPHRARPAPVDLAEVRGQQMARFALEIAAAGHHNLLLIGPPGCGKSMLARRLPTILPPLTFEEALETTRIHAAAGLSHDAGLLHERPFRAPHHTVTIAGLVGDRRLRPGETSLAHHGVLFLDEATEFPRSVLEVLRTPVEDGVVRLVRAEGAIEYPARLSLVLAMNPCPCGRRTPARTCDCADADVERYRRRLSGPLLDRVDLHVVMEATRPDELLAFGPGEASAVVRSRVLKARERALARGQGAPNAALGPSAIEEVARPTPGARQALLRGVQNLELSGRAATRIWRVARTVADLFGDDVVNDRHVDAALGFRGDA